MLQIWPACLILLAICAAIVGCGSEDADTVTPAATNEPKQGPVEAELVVEASKARFTQQGEDVEAMVLVESILAESDTVVPPGYHTQIDREHQRAGQRLIQIFPMHPFAPMQATADEDAGKIFEALKAEFESTTQRILREELAYQQLIAEASARDVKQHQQALQTFLQNRRGLPQTDADRLELRKLDRQIETALQAKIETDQRVEDLQKKIDRDRHIKLLRVR